MWECSKCGCINVFAASRCKGICKQQGINTAIPTEFIGLYDDYESILFKSRVYAIDQLIWFTHYVKFDFVVNGESKVMPMTPQEELFAGFFKDEQILIKDMSILELRAHREELAKIAFEARARLTAVDGKERDLTAKRNKDGRPTGFSTSLQTDELTSNAINKVKERGQKLSKAEKTLQGLLKLGISEVEANKIMSAGEILQRVKDTKNLIVKDEDRRHESQPIVPVVNPFAKKAEDKVEVSIISETDTVIVTKTETVSEEKPKPASFNPFAK